MPCVHRRCLVHTVVKELQDSVAYAETAREMWIDLEECFLQDQFPFASLSTLDAMQHDHYETVIPQPIQDYAEAQLVASLSVKQSNQPIDTNPAASLIPQKENSDVRFDISNSQSTNSEKEIDIEPMLEMHPTFSQPQRTHKRPTYLIDYICYSALGNSNSRSSLQDASSGMSHPLSHFVSYDCFSPKHRAFLAVTTNLNEPKSFSQAINDLKWRDSMAKEIQALRQIKHGL
uniref:Uncharacterized protein n=1 Tax=Ananas comosus var. bracteatus TaxID=296719 RepID=A0A6V7NFL6_ANACO|nr:unnamed protein product [Ananas comosus var. bracteatus]